MEALGDAFGLGCTSCVRRLLRAGADPNGIPYERSLALSDEGGAEQRDSRMMMPCGGRRRRSGDNVSRLPLAYNFPGLLLSRTQSLLLMSSLLRPSLLPMLAVDDNDDDNDLPPLEYALAHGRADTFDAAADLLAYGAPSF